MNNFINLRLKAHNHTKTFSSIKHNLRHIKTLSEKDDLSSDRKHTQENYFFYNDELIKLEKNKDTTKYFYDFVAKQYKEDRKEHNKLWLAANENNKDLKGRSLKNSKATWVEGVFTFSEQFKEDLGNKYTLEELTKIAYECLQEVAQKLGSEIKYLVFHGDETTGHFHYALSNFDERGLSLFHKIKNKEDLSQLQDIAFKHFSKLGMKRGIKRELNSLNYQELKNYYEKHINELKNEKNELIDTLSDLSSKKDFIYSEIENLKDLRNEVSKSLELTKEEKKEIYSEITKAQKELRSYKDEIITKEKEIKSHKDEAINDTLEILKNSKTLLSYDESKLKKLIFNKLKQYSKLDLRLKEFIKLQETNKKLEEEKEELSKSTSKLKDKIQSLEEVNLEKTMYIKELKSKVDNSTRFTNKEVAQVTMKYENEIQELKNDNYSKTKKIEELEKDIDKASKFVDYVRDNHSEIIEDYKENNNSHKRNRQR